MVGTRESDAWMNDGNGRAGLRVSAIRARAFARATLSGGGSEGAPEGGARRSEAPFDDLDAVELETQREPREVQRRQQRPHERVADDVRDDAEHQGARRL